MIFQTMYVVTLLPTLINPLETKARLTIDHCLQCISGAEVGVVRSGPAADLCNAAAA